MQFKTNQDAQIKDAQTKGKPSVSEGRQKPDAEATERLQRYIESSERFQRSVHNGETKTKRP